MTIMTIVTTLKDPRVASTMARALRGAAPRFRGKMHRNAHSHTRSFIEKETTPCVEYFALRWEVPEGATSVIPFEGGWLAYFSPF